MHNTTSDKKIICQIKILYVPYIHYNLCCMYGMYSTLYITSTHCIVYDIHSTQISVLLAPECSLSPRIVSLFGLLSTINNTEEKRLSFLFGKHKCGHVAHTRCFLTWTFTSANIDNEMAGCAYCRAIYRDIKFCFLSLKKRGTVNGNMVL